MKKVTEQELERAKVETGTDCFVLSVPVDDLGSDFTEGVVKKPNLPTISAYLTMVDRDPVAAHQVLLSNCLLPQYSDPNLLTDQDLILGSMACMQGLIRARRGELKKKVSSGQSSLDQTTTFTEKPE